MKLVNYTLLITLLSGSCLAQTEPNTFNKKDLIEKVDRSELESAGKAAKDNTNVDIPKFEMPSIEFDKTAISKKSTAVKNKPVATKPVATKPVATKPVATKPVATKPVATKPVATKPVATKPVATKPVVTLIYADTPITIKEFIKNDKIVVNNGKTLLYRKLTSNTIEYRYFGILPLSSLGLKLSEPNNYTVVNKPRLIRDYNALILSKRKTVKETNNAKKVTEISTETPKANMSTDSKLLIKQVEDRLNRGRSITKTITVKNLKVGDVIVLMNNLQVVQRKNSFSTDKNNFWLSKKIDTTSQNYKKISDDKYRVIN